MQAKRHSVHRDSILNIGSLSHDHLKELTNRIFVNHDITSSVANFKSKKADKELNKGDRVLVNAK